ncbi:MAG: hypothetical protein AAGJ10_06240 [Bacteroidota bacterium]
MPAVYYSNAHIPLIAWMLILATSAWTGIDIAPELMFVACSGAFIVYQIDHSWQVTQADHVNQPARVGWVLEHQVYVWLSIGIAAVIAVTAAWQNTYLVSVSVAVLAAIGLAYSGLRGIKRWLRVPFTKPLLIVMVWVYGTVVWPVTVPSEYGYQPYELALLLLLGAVRACWIGVNVWLAEGVDQVGDAVDGIVVIPERLRGDKQLLHVSGGLAMLGVGGIAGLGLATEQWTPMVWELTGWAILLTSLIYAYRKNQLATPAQRWLRDVLVAWPGGVALWI